MSAPSIFDIQRAVERGDHAKDVAQMVIAHTEARVEGEREHIAYALESTRDECYPTDVFGDPISTDESREACRLLRENGLPPYDTVGATAMRHAYTRAATIARNGAES